MFESVLLDQCTNRTTVSEPRFCKKCQQDKPSNTFPSIQGEICSSCKNKKRDEKLAKKNIVTSKLSAWREAWPHIRTWQ